MKVFTRVATVVLALILAGLDFVYFSPDYNIHQVRSESMKQAVNIGDEVEDHDIAPISLSSVSGIYLFGIS